jgi:glutaconyl-CoA/methylmalonyl-CoA decarboxylase subunit gamma
MRKLRITIGNKSYDVTVEDLTDVDSYQTSSLPVQPAAPPSAPGGTPPSAPSAEPHQAVADGAVTCPMAGVIKSVLVKLSDQVKQGQPLVVLEAMKMENQIAAHVAGIVKSINVQEGDSVREGHVLLVLE